MLWSQQVEGEITAHKFVINHLVPTKYALGVDHDVNNVIDEHKKLLVHDQMLFTWLFSLLSKSILLRILRCKHL
uniref:Uncharacterized protein n=1 Tax=Cajanus cajan TaxID=3821 RepID=A0A151S4N7_CAJCA|nr:hypothetical protein KK1_028450 [Cajanus cajan]